MERRPINLVKALTVCLVIGVLLGLIAWGLFFTGSPQAAPTPTRPLETSSSNTSSNATSPQDQTTDRPTATKANPTPVSPVNKAKAKAVAEKAIRLYGSVGSQSDAAASLSQLKEIATPELVKQLDKLWTDLPGTVNNAEVTSIDFRGVRTDSANTVKVETMIMREVYFSSGMQAYTQTIIVTLKPGKAKSDLIVTDINDVGFDF